MAVFRASARSVDMLGRQQIAGAATAISEVFKNAHDAYALEVRADVSLARSALLIRDDGVGMTPTVFQDAWLTLATGAKVGSQGTDPPSGMVRRAVLGAKGIGRLAIAVVGPNVLVLTRSVLPGSPLVVAFVAWSAFELPGVSLQDVEIPLVSLPPGAQPADQDIHALIELAVDNLRRIAPTALIGEQLATTARAFDVAAAVELQELPGPTLVKAGHGTHYLVSPVSDELLRQSRPEATDSDLTLDLVGFANTMTPGHPPPTIKTSFWVHKSGAPAVDILTDAEFLTPEEFESADHRVVGGFDTFGRFSGSVCVYGKPAVDYQIPWADAVGPSRCGPFDLAFAVIQGNSKESILPPDQHRRLSYKLGRVGGIYVYRDGIRVLPYGRPDFDWLGIEQRRTKSLARAFYSHRRLFGAVMLRSDVNPELQEKAGREGFQQTTPYRQLRSILQGFLERSAADFFVVGGDRSEPFVEGKSALQRQDAARREAQRRATDVDRQRQRLAASIASAYVRIVDGVADDEVGAALASFARSAEFIKRGEGVDTPEVEEYRVASRLAQIRRSLEVDLPSDFGLTRELRRDLAALEGAQAEFETSVLMPARTDVERIALGLRTERQRIDPAAIVKASLLSLERDRIAAEELAGVAIASLQDRLKELTAAVSNRLRTSISDLSAEAQLATLGPSSLDYVSTRVDIEQRLERLYDAACDALVSFAGAVDAVSWEQRNGQIVTSSSVLAVLDEEISDLRDTAEDSLDLVQQGMALAIVDHEFRLVITDLRRSLRELRAWADLNPNLAPLADRMNDSFEHLDSFLTLFTPLQRRLNTRPTTIKGEDIFRFLDSLFGSRLAENGIGLLATQSFLGYSVRGFRATWYPVFVNLVDNAMYWVSQVAPPRTVTLDVVGGNLCIYDTGPGIRSDDEELIWRPRFSRRPGGRGLGLTVAREVLRREGYDLGLGQAIGSGATFVISQISAARSLEPQSVSE